VILTGTLETVDGRPALRFERRLDHPIERVWRAITDPDELAQWFVAPVQWTPEVGEAFESMEQPGEVTEVEPPHVLAWTWGGEQFRFDLAAEGERCVLVFTHVFGDRKLGAQHAAGWEAILGRLDAHLVGEVVSDVALYETFPELNERYSERFGLDPEVGRRAIAAMREQANAEGA
jgi:uncharacterized protein YndB with AHSA1/START domain